MSKFDVKALREKVMASDDIKYGEVYVEEWDVTLPIRTLPAVDLKKAMKYKDDPIRMASLTVIYGCKTREGESVFTETDLAAFEAEKSFGAITAISDAIFEMSGFGDKAVVEAKNE